MYLGGAPPGIFPVEVNTAGKEELLRVPGIGPKSAIRILQARRSQSLGMAELKRIGVVLKRAQYFITCRGKAAARGTRAEIAGALLDPKAFSVGMQQLSLDDLYPRRCRTPPRPCKSWPPAAWRRIQPQNRAAGGAAMSYQAHVTDVAYCYDGSFAGFLCCVFESYARREIPAEVCPPEEGQLNFFGARDIPTDPQRARRWQPGWSGWAHR